MNDRENRISEMFDRAHNFINARVADFAVGGVVLQAHNNLGTARTRLSTHGGRQASGHSSVRSATESRAAARAALREDLEAIARTAKAMADEISGIEQKFRLPRGNNDQNLLNVARAFAADAAPLAAQFIAHEMPADFLTDLNDDIAALEAAIAVQAEGVEDHVGSRAAIGQALEDGLKEIRTMDAGIRNKYANDPATLAEWTSASHIERAPKRSAAPAPPPPIGSAPSTGGAPSAGGTPSPTR